MTVSSSIDTAVRESPILQQRLPHQASSPCRLWIIGSHDYRKQLLELGNPPWSRLRYEYILFNDSRIGDFPFQTILILIVNLFLASSTEASVQGLTFPIEQIKLDPQGILLVCELLGDVAGIAPERELV
jgi:hypothetical protein